MSKRKKGIIGIIIVLTLIVVVFGVPLIIDWLIIGNSFPSNISNENWVSFFGGYFGAIIGGIFSMIGIAITIIFTNLQNNKEREANVRPYCDISVSRKPILSKHIGKAEIRDTSHINRPIYNCFVNIMNFGLGPAIDFRLYLDKKDTERLFSYIPLNIMQYDKVNDVIGLLPGDAADIILSFQFDIDPVSPEDLMLLSNPVLLQKKYSPEEIMQMYPNYEIVLHIIYHDLYGNYFKQGIEMSVQDIMCDEQDVLSYKITHLSEKQQW